MNYQEAKEFLELHQPLAGEEILIFQNGIDKVYKIEFVLILPSITIWTRVQNKIDIGYNNEQALDELQINGDDLDVWLIFTDKSYMLLRDHLNTTI